MYSVRHRLLLLGFVLSTQVSSAQTCPGSLPAGMDCVAAGANKDITAYAICSKVTNNHSSGKAIMVPAGISTEWSEFRTKFPTGVTIGACGAGSAALPDPGITASNVKFMAGFESGTLKEVGTAAGVVQSLVQSNVRSGYYSLKRVASAANNGGLLTGSFNSTTFYSRIGYRRDFPSGLPGATEYYRILKIADSLSVPVAELYMKSSPGSANLFPCIYFNSTYTCSATAITGSSWNLIETKAVISSTVGALQIRQNGTVTVDLTNLNTGTNLIGEIYLDSGANPDGTSAGYFDDILLRTDGYSGEGQIIARQPALSPAGTFTEWLTIASKPFHPWSDSGMGTDLIVSVGANTTQTAAVQSFATKPSSPSLTIRQYDHAGSSISGSSASVFGGSGTSEEVGQVFTVPSNIVAGGIEFFGNRVGSPADSLTVEIRSGSITGTVVASSTVLGSSLPTTGSITKLYFSGDVTFNTGTNYYLRFFRTGARDVSNYASVRKVGDLFSGNLMIKASAVWSDTTSEDVQFNLIAAQDTLLTGTTVINACKSLVAASIATSGAGRSYNLRHIVNSVTTDLDITSKLGSGTATHISSAFFQPGSLSNLNAMELGVNKVGSSGGKEATVEEAWVMCDVSEPTDPCSGKTIGQACASTSALYAGNVGAQSYMVTPSGCTDSATPTCAGGTDTVTKRWEGGSGALRGGDIAGITNITTYEGPSPISQTGDVTTPLITSYANVQAGSAAGYCEDMVYGGYSDWYLPSKTEMAYIYCKAQPTGTHSTARPDEDVNCAKVGGKSSDLTGFMNAYYWTSTEFDGSQPWQQYLNDGNQGYSSKATINAVRCIRKYNAVNSPACTAIDSSWTPKYSDVVSYWKLDGTVGAIATAATLTSTVGGNGTVAGTGSSYAAAKLSTGFVNSGTTYADYSTTSGANNLTAATWAGWVKIDSASQGTIVYKSDGNSSQGWWIDYNTSSGKVGISVVHSSSNLKRYTNDVPANGTWFHLAIVWGGSLPSGSVTIYVNGLPVNSYSTSQNGSGAHNPDAAQPLWLGRPGGGASGYLQGSLDEFAIWRVALSSAEVYKLYNSQSTCP